MSENTGKAAPSKNIFETTTSADFGKELVQRLQELAQSSAGAMRTHYQNVAIAYAHNKGMDVENVGANAAYVSRSGDQGNIAQLRTPWAAALLRKQYNLVVAPELAWIPVATNSDFSSDSETVTAKNALEYYWYDKSVGEIAKAVALQALTYGEAILHMPWNDNLGQDVALDGERIVKDGDIDYRIVPTWHILRDPTAKSWDSLNWVVVREFQDKYDVAAVAPTPDIADKAKATSSMSTNGTSITSWQPWRQEEGTDFIPVYYLYHKPTPAIPNGRQTVFLEDGSVLSDTVLDPAYHKHLPVVRMAAGEYDGTPFPYSEFTALGGLQQASDSLQVSLLTNATATAGTIISVEEDQDTSPLSFGGGPKILPRAKNTAEPKALQLQQSHPEHFNLNNTYQRLGAQILGIDTLTAGEKDGANLSGAAMTMLTSTAVQNNSQLQAKWAAFVQKVGMLTLIHIQKHMPTPRKVVLAGKANASFVTATLSSEAIGNIDRVRIDLGNSVQQQPAGRFELAQMLLKSGWTLSPQQIQMVIDTGRLDNLTQGATDEMLIINQENEALRKGDMDVRALIYDDHALHIQEHRQVTNSLNARKDPKIIDAVSKHIQEHLVELNNLPPQLAALLKDTGGQPNAMPSPGQPPTPPQVNQAMGGPIPRPTVGPPALPPNPLANQKGGPPPGTPPALVRPSGPVAGVIPSSLAIKPGSSH